MRLRDRLRVLLATIAIVMLVPVAAGPQQTEAAWSDPERASATTASGFVARPGPGTPCTYGLLSATFTWTTPTGGVPRGGYIASAFLNGAPVGTPQTYGPTETSGSTSGLLGNLLDNRVYEIRLQAYHSSTAVDGWRSTALVGTVSTTALGLITGCTGLTAPP